MTSGPFREKLSAIAQNNGGNFICLKKATKYAAWCSTEQGHRPYVLLTDWREAKPCIDIFPDVSAPFFTFVVCDGERAFRRASSWLAQLDPSVGGVQVCSCLAEMHPLLLQVVRDYFDPAGMKPKSNNSFVDNDMKSIMAKAKMDYEMSFGWPAQSPFAYMPDRQGFGHAGGESPIRIRIPQFDSQAMLQYEKEKMRSEVADFPQECGQLFWDDGTTNGYDTMSTTMSPIKVEALESSAEQYCKECSLPYDILDSVLFSCRHRYHHTCCKLLSQDIASETRSRPSPCHVCWRVCPDMVNMGVCANGDSCSFNHDRVAVALCRVKAEETCTPWLPPGLYQLTNTRFEC